MCPTLGSPVLVDHKTPTWRNMLKFIFPDSNLHLLNQNFYRESLEICSFKKAFQGIMVNLGIPFPILILLTLDILLSKEPPMCWSLGSEAERALHF